MHFRPCIDLHDGKVKQIVGSTLSDTETDAVSTNFTAEKPSSYYAGMYKNDGLKGGHVIKLGKNNDAAAREALQAYPCGLQVGGGIDADNAAQWLDYGADKVIITSFIFPDGKFCQERLTQVINNVGADNLVLDLSCRKQNGVYKVVSNRWQTFTEIEVNLETMKELSTQCSEFLIHGVDVEGFQQGIEKELVEMLAEFKECPVTYAGGVRNMDDVNTLCSLSNNTLNFTVGSALDIFGGTGITYAELIKREAILAN